MYSIEEDFQTKTEKTSFWNSWQILAIKVIGLLALAIWLQKPTGSLQGHIAIEKKGFGFYTYDLSKNHVCAIAIGPRGPFEQERGVWIDKDGGYKISQLPVGEYQIKVRATGFDTGYETGLFVDEAKSTDAPTIELAAITPSISIATDRRVFTTNEAPGFWVNATGCANTTVRVYRKNVLESSDKPSAERSKYIKDFTDQAYGNVNALAERKYGTWFGATYDWSKEVPFKTFNRTFEQTFDQSLAAQFKFDNPLPPGEYWMTVNGKSTMGGEAPSTTAWFIVSNLGLIIMRAPEKTVVRAIDLTTLKPVKGATVAQNAWTAGHKNDKTKLTDGDGFVTFPTIKAPAKTTLSLWGDVQNADTTSFVGTFGQHKAYDDVTFWTHERETYNTYMYTERPVYRLGQTAYFKGLVREKTFNGNKNPGGKLALAVNVKDDQGTEIWHGKLHTNDHGTFNGSVAIPEDGHTGTYQINIEYPDKTTTSESFEIEEYRKPEYLVEVKPETTRVVAGEKMKAKVHATYFFGGPVANAKVKYSVYASTDYSLRYSLKPRPSYYSFFDDWDGNNYSGGFGGDFVCDGEALTDGNGDAQVEFNTKTIDVDPKNEPSTYDFQDKRYKIEAEVTDISRISVSGSASESATAGDFELFVSPDSYVAAVGQPLGVTIEALDYEGKPVANQKINLTMSRMLWDQATYTNKGSQIVTDTSICTGANGVAHATMQVGSWPSDTFYVSATTKDARGHMIFNSTSMWICNGLQPYMAHAGEEQNQPVTLKMDKPIYEPGDKAKVIITGPVHGNEGVQAIVSVQGQKLYSYQVINMDATAKLVEIPIKKEWAPNAYVAVAIVDTNHHFYSQEEPIRVSPESNFLNITIDSDKKKYHPGDKVQYTIKATKHDGTPAPNTELSLSVVDEAIYSIRPDSAGDIRKAFYTRTQNNVLTSCSFPEEYSAGPDKGAADEPVVRKDFRDIAAWLPNVTTDEKGVAVATIKLPDNLTTWRATVRGIDMQTDVGTAMQKVLCSQDLILRIALPRFFTQGDEGLVTAVVHNYSDITQNVTLTLKASNNFKTTAPTVQKLSLLPEKAGRFSWPVSIETAGTGLINIKAVGQGAGDAVEQKLPIRTLGIPAFSAKAGLMNIDQQTVTIPAGLTGDAVRSGAKFKLNVASSTLGPVLGNFSALIDYPYGCTEQTMSRLVPSVVAMQLHTRLGQPLTAKDKKKFDEVYARAIEKLAGYRHADGGWGWWANDESNTYLTALVVNGMQLLKDAGYKPDPEWTTGGLAYLNKQDQELFSQMSDTKIVQDWWVNEKRTDLTKSLFTESEFKSYPTKAMTKWFSQSVESLCPESLSYLCLAYKNAGDMQTAHLFYDRLIALSNGSKETMDWEHTPALIKKMHAKDKKKVRYWFDDYSYRFTAVESTALALRCVLTMEPENTERIENIKRWIMLHRDENGWENTKTTAEVFLVLLQDELQARTKGAGNYTARISLDEKTVEEFTANAADLYASQKDYNLPIPEKPTSLVIEKNGGGRLYYSTLMTYFRKMKRGDTVTEKAMPEGLRIRRKFYRLAAADKVSTGGMHFHTEELRDGKVKAGETILMKVFVEAPYSIPYVMVDAALPSGGEVVEDSSEDANVDSSNATPDETGANPKDAVNTGDWERAWWTHRDVLDDRIVFFGTSLPEGKSVFHALIRMELPGRLGINPVSLNGMYTEKVRGYSNLDELVVTEEAGK